MTEQQNSFKQRGVKRKVARSQLNLNFDFFANHSARYIGHKPEPYNQDH